MSKSAFKRSRESLPSPSPSYPDILPPRNLVLTFYALLLISDLKLFIILTPPPLLSFLPFSTLSPQTWWPVDKQKWVVSLITKDMAWVVFHCKDRMSYSPFAEQAGVGIIHAAYIALCHACSTHGPADVILMTLLFVLPTSCKSVCVSMRE